MAGKACVLSVLIFNAISLWFHVATHKRLAIVIYVQCNRNISGSCYIPLGEYRKSNIWSTFITISIVDVVQACLYHHGLGNKINLIVLIKAIGTYV